MLPAALDLARLARLVKLPTLPLPPAANWLARLARFTLAGFLGLAILAWPLPDYAGWGLLFGGALLTLAIWLLADSVTGRSGVAVTSLHLPLALLAGIMIARWAAGQGLGKNLKSLYDEAGDMEVSIAYHAIIAMIVVSLAADLFSSWRPKTALLSLSGLAIWAGPMAAMLLGRCDSSYLALLACAGAAILLSAAAAPAGAYWRKLRLLWVTASLAMAVLPLCLAPHAIPAAACAIALAAAAALSARRRLRVLAILLLPAAVLIGWLLWDRPSAAAPFGLGASGLFDLTPESSGVRFIAAIGGWVSVAVLLAGGTVAAVRPILAVPQANRLDRWRISLWTCGVTLAAAAMLSPQGWFSPAVTAAVLWAFGLLPLVAGRGVARLGGWALFTLLLVMLMLLGLAAQPGLLVWSRVALQMNDHMLHIMAGLLIALALGWWLGARRWWLGLVGLLLAAAAGGAGELAQWAFTERTADLTDFYSHLDGTAIGSAAFILSLLCRWSWAGL